MTFTLAVAFCPDVSAEKNPQKTCYVVDKNIYPSSYWDIAMTNFEAYDPYEATFEIVAKLNLGTSDTVDKVTYDLLVVATYVDGSAERLGIITPESPTEGNIITSHREGAGVNRITVQKVGLWDTHFASVNVQSANFSKEIRYIDVQINNVKYLTSRDEAIVLTSANYAHRYTIPLCLIHPVTSVVSDQSSTVEIPCGSSKTLKFHVLPKNADYQEMTFTLTGTKELSLSRNKGTWTNISGTAAPGTTGTVTATSIDETNLSATVDVIVTMPNTIPVSAYATGYHDMTMDETAKLNISSSLSKYLDITYKITNKTPEIISYDQDTRTITPVAPGDYIIEVVPIVDGQEYVNSTCEVSGSVVIKPEQVVFDPQSVVLYYTTNPDTGDPVFQTKTIKYNTTPENASRSRLTIKTADQDICRVDRQLPAEVELYSKSIGTTKLIAYWDDTPIGEPIDIIVEEWPKTESILIEPAEPSMLTGDEIAFTATTKPDNAMPFLKWSSSIIEYVDMPDVAYPEKDQIDAKTGVFKPFAPGIYSITAQANDGSGIKSYTRVTVKPARITKIHLSSTEKTLMEDNKCRITISYEPDYAIGPEIDVATSDPDVAEIDAQGNVTAKKAGTCVFTFTSIVNGQPTDVTAQATITVTPRPRQLLITSPHTTYSMDDNISVDIKILPENAPQDYTITDLNNLIDNGDGTYRVQKNGTASISAQSTIDESVKGKLVFDIKPINVSGISAPDSITLFTNAPLDETRRIKVEPIDRMMHFANGTGGVYYYFEQWHSSDPDVATVDSNGVIRPQRQGQAIVSVTVGDITHNIKVVVLDKQLNYCQFAATPQTSFNLNQYGMFSSYDGGVLSSSNSEVVTTGTHGDITTHNPGEGYLFPKYDSSASGSTRKINVMAFHEEEWPNETSASYFEYGLNDDGTLEITGIHDDIPETVVLPTKATYLASARSVTSLSDDVFYRKNTPVRDLYIPGSIQLKKGSFVQCNLRKVVLGEGRTSLPENLFYGSSIKSLTLPMSLSSLEKNVLYNCNSLQEIHLRSANPPSCPDIVFPLNYQGKTYYPADCKDAYIASKWNRWLTPDYDLLHGWMAFKLNQIWLKPGETYQTEYLYGGFKSDKPVVIEWTSNEPTIASVDDKGLITAIKHGWAKITARINDVKLTLAVLVHPDLPEMSISPDPVIIERGSSASPELHLSTGETSDVAWSIDSDLTVDKSTGKITTSNQTPYGLYNLKATYTHTFTFPNVYSRATYKKAAWADVYVGSNYATELQLTSHELTMNVGDDYDVQYDMAPNTSTVFVYSDDSNVVKVIGHTMRAFTTGTANITITDGRLVDHCVVTVLPGKDGLLLGDSNSDGRVSVADVVNTCNHLLELETVNFNKNAADIDRNGAITVSDATGTVRIILRAGGSVSLAQQMARRASSIDNGALRFGEYRTTDDGRILLPVMIDSDIELSALQADFTMPEGIRITNFVNTCGSDMSLDYACGPDGRSRVVAYRLDNGTLPYAGSGELFAIELAATESMLNGEILCENVIGADPSAHEWHLGGSRFDTAHLSGIAGITASRINVTGHSGYAEFTGCAGMTARIFTVDGKSVNAFCVSTDSEQHYMQPGIYVVVVDGQTFKIHIK